MKPISYTKLPLFLTTKAYAQAEHVYVESVSGVTDGHYVSNEAISAGAFDSTKWTYVDANHYVAQGLPQYTVDSAMSSSSTNPVQNCVIKTALDGKQATIGSTTDLTVKTLTGGLTYLTTEPTADNDDGIKIVYLSAEPTTKYDGYLYLIAES